MGFRLIGFVVAALLAGALAGVFAGLAWAAPAALAAVLAWLVFDSLRLRRLLRALRADPPVALSRVTGGPWREMADRVRRLLREREQQVNASEARLQEFLTALRASPNGMVLLDEQGRIEWCNATAASHFGFDAQRDVMQHIGNLVRDPQFASYLASWNYSRDVVMTSPAQYAPGGTPLRLSVQVHAYAGNRRLLLTRDVTALEQAEAMRRDFVANVSHEIRTPLTVLAGFVETMQTLTLTDEERSRYLGLMAQQSQRMQTLVSDLLTLSRLEGSPLPGMAEWTPVQALMAECEQEGRALSSVLASSPARRHVLQFDVEGGGEIAGAHAELLSAMSNLVSNAVRYTPGGGSIKARWHPLPDGGAEFSVKDSGPGIAAEHISRLTERFYRVDRSRSRETGGTGLGLAIVKHVVQRHGAELRIESTPGAGSTFSIVFPAVRLRRGIAAQPASRDAVRSAAPATGSAAG